MLTHLSQFNSAVFLLNLEIPCLTFHLHFGFQLLKVDRLLRVHLVFQSGDGFVNRVEKGRRQYVQTGGDVIIGSLVSNKPGDGGFPAGGVSLQIFLSHRPLGTKQRGK